MLLLTTLYIYTENRYVMYLQGLFFLNSKFRKICYETGKLKGNNYIKSGRSSLSYRIVHTTKITIPNRVLRSNAETELSGIWIVKLYIKRSRCLPHITYCQ